MISSGQTDFYLIIFIITMLLIALATDMKAYKIPNVLTYPAAVAVLIFHTALHGMSGFLFSLLGMVAGLGIFFLPFALGFMGAGDVKLMGVVGATLGARGVLNACIFTSLAGGILAIALLAIYNRNLKFISSYADALNASIGEQRVINVPSTEKENKPKVYYALAIAAGTIFTICWKATFSCYPL